MQIYRTVLSLAIVVLQVTAGPTIKLLRFASSGGLTPDGINRVAACATKPIGEDALKAGFCKTWPDKDTPFEQFKFHGKVRPNQHCQLLVFEKRGCEGTPIAIVGEVTQKNAGYNCLAVWPNTCARSAMLQCDPSISGDDKVEKKKEKLRVESAGMPMPAVTAMTGGTQIRALGWALPTTTELVTISMGPGVNATLTWTHFAPSRSSYVPTPDKMQSLVDASQVAAAAQQTEIPGDIMNLDW